MKLNLFVLIFMALFLAHCGREEHADYFNDELFDEVLDVTPVPTLTGTWNLRETIDGTNCARLQEGAHIARHLVVKGDKTCTVNGMEETGYRVHEVDCAMGANKVIADLQTSVKHDDYCVFAFREKMALFQGSDTNFSGDFKVRVMLSGGCSEKLKRKFSGCVFHGTITGEMEPSPEGEFTADIFK